METLGQKSRSCGRESSLRNFWIMTSADRPRHMTYDPSSERASIFFSDTAHEPDSDVTELKIVISNYTNMTLGFVDEWWRAGQTVDSPLGG
jgi:hypothetical protein